MHDTASINKVGTLATRPCGPRSHRSHQNINGHITRLQSPSHEVPVTPNESTTETSTSINKYGTLWFRFHARRRVARISLLPILSNPLTSTRYNDYLQLSPKSEWSKQIMVIHARFFIFIVWCVSLLQIEGPAARNRRRSLFLSYIWRGCSRKIRFLLQPFKFISLHSEMTPVSIATSLYRNTSFQES